MQGGDCPPVVIVAHRKRPLPSTEHFHVVVFQLKTVGVVWGLLMICNEKMNWRELDNEPTKKSKTGEMIKSKHESRRKDKEEARKQAKR